MFTGYIFVFVWDVMQHLSRIEAIPGIARVMHSLVETRKAVIKDGVEIVPAVFQERPVILSDEIIDKIRIVENIERPLKAVMSETTVVRKKKPRWRKAPKQAAPESDNDIIAVRPWSAFQDSLLSLDTEGRNQTLLTALGLS
jgi:hypothetical protein